jgi:RNA recognition motif-containing protein
MNIYVGNISREANDTDLQNLFSVYGNVDRVKIIRDNFTGESKGFGFVEMPNQTEALKAVNELNSQDLKGRKIVVNEARPKTEGGGDRSRNNSFSRDKKW